jgi:3-oxoacyl-[acyl-carrier protein] reductase
MQINLIGRNALVLGGNKGIGFGIARGLAEAGAQVILTSRSLGDAEAAATKIGASGLACDTGAPESVSALCAVMDKVQGGIDILVLNSGGPPPGSAMGVSSEQWRASFESMFVGLVRVADHLLPSMRAKKHGRILSVISSGVIEPIPNLAISNAIRPALTGWMKTLSNEIAKDGITVNAIAPGRIETDRLLQIDTANATKQSKSMDEIRAAAMARIPAGRYGTVDEFAAAAVFLASDQASFMTGSIIRVDGGQIASTM